MNLRQLRNFVRNTASGQGLVEYALILALISIVAILALQFIGSGVNATLSAVGNSL